MKKYLKCIAVSLILIITALSLSACNKDWEQEQYWVGIYTKTETLNFKGCKSCSPTHEESTEIDIYIILNADGTYKISYSVVGVEDSDYNYLSQGKWEYYKRGLLSRLLSMDGIRYTIKLIEIDEKDNTRILNEHLSITGEGNLYYHAIFDNGSPSFYQSQEFNILMYDSK